MSNNERNFFEAYSINYLTSIRDKIRNVAASENLSDSRNLIKKIAAELKISYLDCAAALAFADIQNVIAAHNVQPPPSPVGESPKRNVQPGIRLVRYRLDVGRNHKVNIDILKKVLVDESGVDINNIVNLRIQESFSLVDLPDEMPQEIFHHLKEVEINNQKLAIKRLKFRNKRRSQSRAPRVARR